MTSQRFDNSKLPSRHVTEVLARAPSVGASVAPVGDPTPLNGSTLMYVFGQQEDRQCRESATSPKISFDQPPSSGPVGMLVFRPGSRFGSDLQSSG